ncbi:MAG: glycerophosphodiester phosphodiesterase [Treponema sp.]|jgi:glycerophosphoryl diester phosphodiesterase|nr:glycerophosphodiester phosphodiesterase [Treponema sp.]
MRTPLLPDRPRPLVFAHRGCSSLAPENTFAAFRKARETGSPGIELDVHASADGRLVVAHDDTFRRVFPDGFTGDKKLEELNYGEIRRVDAGSFFDSAFSGERPPLLEEVLEEFCPDMYVDIELKSRKTKGDPLPGLLAERLAALGGTISGSVTVSSFNPICLAAFKKAWSCLSDNLRNAEKRAAGIPAAVIFCVDQELPWPLRRGFGRFIAGCDYLKPRYNQVTAFSRFRWAGLEGRPVVPWTVDDRAAAEALVRPGPAGIPGCAGVITNRPQDVGTLRG